MCWTSLYITNSGSGQTQATGSWTGSRKFIYRLSGAGGYQTSSNGNNTFIGAATVSIGKRAMEIRFLGVELVKILGNDRFGL